MTTPHPTAPAVVYSCTITVSVYLPPDLQRLACRSLSLHHVGKETIPLDEKPPPELVEVHRNVARGDQVRLRVGVREDGSMTYEVVNE